MKILVFEPQKAAYVTEMSDADALTEIQKIVDGNLEPIMLKYGVIAWCDESFLFKEKKPNRYIKGELIRGTFVVTGISMDENGERDWCSLSDEQIEMYKDC